MSLEELMLKAQFAQDAAMLLNIAWGIIANVDWVQMDEEWIHAAEGFRDEYHLFLTNHKMITP